MTDVPANVHSVLAEPGRPLDTATRGLFEHRLGADFRSVRVHHGPEAEASARDVAAHAYTVGSDIVFARGRYAPGSREGRELLAHELVHVIQQQDGVSRGPILQRKADRCDPGQTEVTITATDAMSGRDFFVESVIRGRHVSRQRAEKLIADDEVECAHPKCETGLEKGESVSFCFGPPSLAPKRPPPRAPALVQGALDSPRLGRFIRAGTEKKRLKLLDTYRAGDFDAILAIHHTLLGLNDDDLACYWRWAAGGGVPEGWVNIAGSLADFTAVRQSFCNPVDLSIQGPLAGTESEYALIKQHERLKADLVRSFLRPSLASVDALIRGEEPPVDPVAELRANEAARDKALHDAGFEDEDAYLEAANAFRVRFRTRALALLMHELNAADVVMVDALSRYQLGSKPDVVLRRQVPKACEELYDQIRAASSKDEVMAVHPILRGTGVWEEISQARDVCEFCWRLSLFALQRRVDLDFVRKHAQRDSDVVFKFDPIVDETANQFGIDKGSIFDLVIKEQIGKPGEPWWMTVIDLGLLVLSFVPGPIGFAARLVNAGRHIGGEITEYDQQLRAYDVGVRTERPSAKPILYASLEEVAPQVGFSVAGKAIKAIRGARAATGVAGAVGSDITRAESHALTTTVTDTEQAIHPSEIGAPQPAPVLGGEASPAEPTVSGAAHPQPESAPVHAEAAPTAAPAEAVPAAAPAEAQPAPPASARDEAIARQEGVVARKGEAMGTADLNAAKAQRAVVAKQQEVARLAAEKERLARELAAADKAAAGGARGTKGPAERAGVAARKAEREWKSASKELEQLEGTRDRLVAQADRRAEELGVSESHLKKTRESSPTEAPRQRPGEPFSPANRRPNNSDFPDVPAADIDHIPELEPGHPKAGMRTNPDARVAVFKERPVSRVRAQHDDLLARLQSGNEQQLGHEYEELLGEDLVEGGGDLRQITKAGDKTRVTDLGVHEFTIEKELSDGKLDQLWRDLQTPNVGGAEAANRVLLTVPRLSTTSAARLAKMAAIYERLTGRRPTIIVRVTAP